MGLRATEAVAALAGPALTGKDRELLAFGVGVGGMLGPAARPDGGPRRRSTGESDRSGSPDGGPDDEYRKNGARILRTPPALSLYDSVRGGTRQQQRRQLQQQLDLLQQQPQQSLCGTGASSDIDDSSSSGTIDGVSCEGLLGANSDASSSCGALFVNSRHPALAGALARQATASTSSYPTVTQHPLDVTPTTAAITPAGRTGWRRRRLRRRGSEAGAAAAASNGHASVYAHDNTAVRRQEMARAYESSDTGGSSANLGFWVDGTITPRTSSQQLFREPRQQRGGIHSDSGDSASTDGLWTPGESSSSISGWTTNSDANSIASSVSSDSIESSNQGQLIDGHATTGAPWELAASDGWSNLRASMMPTLPMPLGLDGWPADASPHDDARIGTGRSNDLLGGAARPTLPTIGACGAADTSISAAAEVRVDTAPSTGWPTPSGNSQSLIHVTDCCVDDDPSYATSDLTHLLQANRRATASRRRAAAAAMHAARTEAADRMRPRDVVLDKTDDDDVGRHAGPPADKRRDGNDGTAMDEGVLRSPRRFFRASSGSSGKTASAAAAAAASAAAALVSAAGTGTLRLAKSGSRFPRRVSRSGRGMGGEPTSERGWWNASSTSTPAQDGPASVPAMPCARHNSYSGTGGAGGSSNSGGGSGGGSGSGVNSAGGTSERRFLGSRAAAALHLLDRLSLSETLPSTIAGRAAGHGGMPTTTAAAATDAHSHRMADWERLSEAEATPTSTVTRSGGSAAKWWTPPSPLHRRER